MRKLINITFGLLILFSLTGYCQTNLGLFIHPTIDYANADIHHFNYSVGLKSDIKIYNGLYVKVAMGYEHDYFDLTKMPQLFGGTLSNAIVTTNLIKTDCHLKYDFIHKNKVLSFYIFGGPTVNTNFHELRTWAYINPIEENNNIRISNILIAGGLGLGIKLKQIVILTIEPTYSTPIWRNKDVVRGFGNRYGLNIGVAYMFKKNN